MRYNIILLFVIITACFASDSSNRDIIATGSSRADVLRVLGQPNIRTIADSLLSLEYGETHIILVNDTVTRYRVGENHRKYFQEYPVSNGPKTVHPVVPSSAPQKIGTDASPKTAVPAKFAASPDPCRDSLFLRLKQKELDSLSQREYEYLMQKDRQCHAVSLPPDGNSSTSLSNSRAATASSCAVNITSNMPSEVYIDDALVGTTPVKLSLQCAAYIIALYNSSAIQSAWDKAEFGRMKARSVGMKSSRAYLDATKAAQKAEASAASMQSTRRKVLLLPGYSKILRYENSCVAKGGAKCADSAGVWTISESNKKND